MEKKEDKRDKDRILVEYERSNRFQLPPTIRIKVDAKDQKTAMAVIDRFLPTKKEEKAAMAKLKKKL